MGFGGDEVLDISMKKRGALKIAGRSENRTTFTASMKKGQPIQTQRGKLVALIREGLSSRRLAKGGDRKKKLKPSSLAQPKRD